MIYGFLRHVVSYVASSAGSIRHFDSAPYGPGPRREPPPRPASPAPPPKGTPIVHTIYLALMRASDASDVAAALREAHEHAFVEPLREMLEGPDADLRARLVAAAIGGLLSALWLVGDEYLVTADHQTLITAYAGAIQQLITPNASTESGSSV